MAFYTLFSCETLPFKHKAKEEVGSHPRRTNHRYAALPSSSAAALQELPVPIIVCQPSLLFRAHVKKEVTDDQGQEVESMDCSGPCRLYSRCRGAPPIGAQPAGAAEEPGNTGRISLNLGVDWVRNTSSAASLSKLGAPTSSPRLGAFKLVEHAGPLTALTATPGIWNNWHAGDGNLVDPVDPKFWYEADLYFTLAAMLEAVTVGLTYTAYTSPNDSFATVQELALGLSLNDSKWFQWFEGFALNPTLLLAGEFSGQADAGATRGVYLQLGLNPGYTFAAESTTPVTLSFPVTLGLSVSNYYEFATGDNPAFGYVQFGPAVTLALGFMPKSFGTWVVKGALELLVLGDTLETLNDNDAFKPIGRIGVAVVY